MLYSITNAPIMFASIHGVYDLREELEEPIVVPPNAIVIEVADMGEVTLTTIDPLLWELIQNRELFRSIIAGERVEGRFLPTLRALHLYMPGDLLYKRKLIYEPENEFDNRWALYRFAEATTGIPFPRNHGTAGPANAELNSARFRPISDDFLRGIKTMLYRVDGKEGPSLRSGRAAHGRNENYSQVQFIRDCQGQYGTDPTIYIISACADMWLNAKSPSAAERARDYTLSRNQRDVDIRNYDCEIETLAFQGDPAGAQVQLWEGIGTPAARPVAAREETPYIRPSRAKAAATGAPKSASGWSASFAPAAGPNNSAVTGNTSAARAFLEDAEPVGQPKLGNLNGPIALLFTKDGTSIPNGISANWPRKNAEEYAKGKELLTVTRDATGKIIFVPFIPRRTVQQSNATNSECEKGVCCKFVNGVKKCFKSMGFGGKRSRRSLKKSKKTRKTRKFRRN